MNISQDVIENVVTQTEETFGVYCIVTHSKEHGYTVAFSGEEEKIEGAMKSFDDKINPYTFIPLRKVSFNVEKFASICTRDPNFLAKRMRNNVMGIPTLFDPVIHGEDCRKELFDELEEKMGKREFRNAVRRANYWNKTREKRAERINARIMGEEQKWQGLLPEPEIRELRYIIPDLVKYCEQKGVKSLIGLDRSGRPVALLMHHVWKKLYGETPKVYFLDLHNIDKIDENSIETLREQHPNLYEEIKENPKKIVFVDDQVWFGHGKEKLDELSESISGEKVEYIYMSSVFSHRTPSWRSKSYREDVGIEPTKEFVSRKIKDADQRKIIEFRKRLKIIAKNIKIGRRSWWSEQH